MRVLKWMLERVAGAAQGAEHVFGTSPRYEDLNWTGLDFSRAQFEQVTASTRAPGTRAGLHDELFKQLAYHLPGELTATKARIETRLVSDRPVRAAPRSAAASGGLVSWRCQPDRRRLRRPAT